MSAPLVSVVIPCYRQGHLLPEALASVFAQTHPAVEAVVVNDGSDDNTDEVARGYLPRVRYVSQNNAGLPAARNAGIQVATGQYLLFLDADDLLHERAVEWLVAATNGREDVLAVCGWRKFTTDPTRPIEPDRFPQSGDPFPRFIHDNPAPPHAYLCSRTMVDRLGRFASDVYACEDWDLWMRLGLAGATVVAAPHVGAFYRLSPGSMSTNRGRMLATRIKILMQTYARFLERPELLTRWGPELALAALRVRRRLIAQNIYPESVPALSEMIGDLARRGFRPPLKGKEAILARLIGRERADRLMLAYYRRFDKPMFEFYQQGHA